MKIFNIIFFLTIFFIFSNKSYAEKVSIVYTVDNVPITSVEINNEIIFLRKLVPGGSEHSFGINVAQLAGMPNKILIRAYEVLKELEKKPIKKKIKVKDLKKQNQLKLEYSNPDYEKAKKVIEDININNINPVQALVKLNEIIDIIKSSKNWFRFFLKLNVISLIEL